MYHIQHNQEKVSIIRTWRDWLIFRELSVESWRVGSTGQFHLELSVILPKFLDNLGRPGKHPSKTRIRLDQE